MRMTGIGHIEATFSSDNRVTGEVPSLSNVTYLLEETNTFSRGRPTALTRSEF